MGFSMENNVELMDLDDPMLLKQLQDELNVLRSENKDSYQPRNSERYQFNQLQNNSELEVDNEICIVVDTNIFISQLSLLNSILNEMKTLSAETRSATSSSSANNYEQWCLIIPYTVLNELDKLKLRDSTKTFARQSVNWLLKQLDDGNQHIRCQTPEQRTSQSHQPLLADDLILDCAQYWRNFKHKAVLLLTNDKVDVYHFLCK